jgi:tetratricopeptide (TPR) repeat protein
MEALRLALKDERYTEARISGGLNHSRYTGVTRGSDRNDDNPQFDRALARLKTADQANAPVNDTLTLARVYLARGTREDAKHALLLLNQLAPRGVETPEALNDTGVAYMQLDDNDKAIGFFTRALAKAPNYDEAVFNKALAEQSVHLYDDAKRDWQQFIDQSSDEKWKAEAADHLNALGRGR